MKYVCDKCGYRQYVDSRGFSLACVLYDVLEENAQVWHTLIVFLVELLAANNLSNKSILRGYGLFSSQSFGEWVALFTASIL